MCISDVAFPVRWGYCGGMTAILLFGFKIILGFWAICFVAGLLFHLLQTDRSEPR